ncbi:tetratricopeptide repeat protein [Nonomuraea sp. C10]|uniref:tetratricopeptide repeat protein n=1 Tax=Nonomuraea sp. C10 TaxID=2600577 RepID=UPI0011CDFC62|nr:tetratricopeptide repeat protein [Nonomuraea sp. C10]TXK39470.1 tetratricopeptide repeat protein [Nonomuraea sp. C10]
MRSRRRFLYCRALSIGEPALFPEGPPGINGEETDTEDGDPTNRRDALRFAALLPALASLPEDTEPGEFTRHSEETDVGATTLDQVRQAIATYGTDYATQPASELWEPARQDRRHVAALLQRRTTLRQRRDLYVDAAWLSTILAWFAHDGGKQRTALAYAHDAWRHADEAEHAETAAWAKDVEATILLYGNRPAEALRAARTGAARAPAGGPAAARLVSQAMRISARPGRGLGTLGSAPDHLPAHQAGLFSADVARFHSFAATSYLWLGDPRSAETHAKEALDLYASAPGISPTRRAISLLDLAIAKAQLRDLDGALSLGASALQLSRPASAIADRSKDLGTVLGEKFPQSVQVKDWQAASGFNGLRH